MQSVQEGISHSLLAGRFRPLRVLGEGGYGVVYEALDLEWNAHVALKTLQRMEPDALLRFKDEFRSLQGIEHRNLVQLGELMCSEGLWFFTMELVNGTDFFDYVRPIVSRSSTRILRGFDERRLRRALVQLADVLIAVHACGRVHCDIKPQNIRVEKSGRLVLLDFGLVTALTGGVHEGHRHVVWGTPSHMAPEQATGGAITAASDMYSVGVLLYEALTGQLPFEGSGNQVMVDKVRFVAPDPRDVMPRAPADLSELAMQLLSIQAFRRPSSRALLGALVADNDALLVPAVDAVVERAAEAIPFVGREAELRVLGDVLAQTSGGRPTFAYVSGDSGLGKTSLVKFFAEEAERKAGALVLKSRCYERETVPFKAFDGIVDDLAQYLNGLDSRACRGLLSGDAKLLIQVFPVLGSVELLSKLPAGREPRDANVQRDLAFGALTEILARIALERPLILVIDDLQWTDKDSLHVLAELLSGALAPSCMVLATGRPLAHLPVELRLALESLLRVGLGTEVAMAGLAEQEAVALAASMGGDAMLTQRIAQEAKGHPLFVAELVRHIEAGHELSGSVRLEDALLARIERLEPPTRCLLEILAIASAPLAHNVLARAVSIESTELGRRLAQLRVAYLARSEDRNRSDCYHNRVRRTVLDAMAQDVKETRHRKLATALMEGSETDSERIAEQWACSGDPRRAARFYAKAAEAAHRALAFNRALRLYELALHHPDALAQEYVLELRVAYAHALSCAGFAGRAAQAYCDAAALHRGEEARTLRCLATQLMLRSGRIAEGLDLADAILADVGMSRPATPTRAVGRLLWERARLWAQGIEHRPLGNTPAVDGEVLRLLWAVAPSLSFVDMLGGTALQTTYVRRALSSGDPLHVVRALTGHALMMSTMEPPPQTRVTGLLAQARRVAETSDQPYLHALVRLSHGYVHWVNFRMKEAIGQLVQAERILRESCVDVAWELTNARAGLLNALWNAGKLGQQEELTRDWQRDARDRGDRYAETQLTVIGLNYQIALRMDNPVQADAAIDGALAGLPDAFQLPQLGAYIGRQLVGLYRGDGSAYRLLRSNWPHVHNSRLLHVGYLSFLLHGDAGWACLDEATRLPAADRSPLLAEAERHAAALLATARPLASAFADQIRGQVELLRGRRADSIEYLTRAEAALRSAGSVYQFSTAYLLGRVLGNDEGRVCLQRALAWAEREGVVAPDRWLAMFAPVVRSLR